MGLFDIFKRRSKKAKEKRARQEAAEQQSSADSKESLEQSSEIENTHKSESAVRNEDIATETTSTEETSSVHANESLASSSSSQSTNDKTSNIKSSSDVEYDSSDDATTSNRSSDDEQHQFKVEKELNSSPGSEKSSNEASAVSHADPNKSSAPQSTDESSKTSSQTANVSLSSDHSLTSETSPIKSDNATGDDKKDQDEAAVQESTQQETESEKYEHGLAKSRSSFGQKLNALFANFRSVDDDFFDDLEDTLIESDVGFDMAIKLTDQLRDEVKLRNVKKAKEVQNVVVEKLIELYDQAGNNDVQLHFADQGPTVILFVGVNGVGKTTTIGKLANYYHQHGKKVLLAAADTFRAGAIQQLDVWAKRADVDIVKKPEGSDPASVVYEAVQKAKQENYDILFVDTAGRLQNKVNLMNELAKMKKILTREIPQAPHEVLLVLDATTGQNALSQAKLFKKTTDVTGIVLTKLDGSARGGIVLAIRNELHIPVKLVGLGEQIGDLRPFNASDYVYGLFKGLLK